MNVSTQEHSHSELYFVHNIHCKLYITKYLYILSQTLYITNTQQVLWNIEMIIIAVSRQWKIQKVRNILVKNLQQEDGPPQCHQTNKLIIKQNNARPVLILVPKIILSHIKIPSRKWHKIITVRFHTVISSRTQHWSYFKILCLKKVLFAMFILRSFITITTESLGNHTFLDKHRTQISLSFDCPAVKNISQA